MKTARRQELRTNELSVQIDQISEQVKQNYTTIITVIVAVTVVAGGIYWYISSSRSRLMEGWATLSSRGEQADAERDIGRFEDVIAQNLDPKLNAAAWLKIGETALAQYTIGSGATPEDAKTGDPKWLEKAQNAYTNALASGVLDKNAIAEVTIHMGILAEDRGDFDKAAEQYRKITNDPKFAGSPFFAQAEFRLKHLDNWRSPVVFAPPPPKPQPTTLPTSTQLGLPEGMDVVTSQPEAPANIESIIESIKNAPGAAPAPTTQPATP